MMNYDLFKKIVAERLPDYLPDEFRDYEVSAYRANKVNEEKDALTLFPKESKGSGATPIVYLDDMYEEFSKSEDLEYVLRCAAGIIAGFAGKAPNMMMASDLSELRDKIVPCIINTERNRTLLESVPHVDVLDMSVIYRFVVPDPSNGINSAIINYNIMKELDMDMEELHAVASENIRTVLPLRVSSITKEGTADYGPEIPEKFTFLSSIQLTFGASYILFNDVMDRIADDMGSERVYVIPFSIDECCIVDANEHYLDFLLDILRDSNSDRTSRSSFLSCCIYVYDSTKKALLKAAEYRDSRRASSWLN